MGFADSVTGRSFATRRRSDLEFEIQSIMQRKLAVLDACNQVSAQMSNSIFSTGLNGSISTGSALPGATYPNNIPGVAVPQSIIGTAGTSENYEAELAQLQSVEKELEVQQNMKETELEAVKAEEESLKKIADDHAKKDFKIG